MENIKKYLYGAVGAIITVLLGIIFHLNTRVKGLQGKNAELETEKKLGEVITKYEEQRNVASDAESEYKRVRDEYLRSDDDKT